MNRFLTIPNVISLARIYLTIPIIVLIWLEGKYYLSSLILVAIACVTDAIDGIVARSFGQVSDWGKILDPLGDKILSTALAITFFRMDVVSFIFAVVVVLRDLLISIFSTRIARNYSFIHQPTMLGKITTFSLFAFYLLIMLHLITPLEKEVVRKLEIVILLLVVVSGVYYLRLYVTNRAKNEE